MLDGWRKIFSRPFEGNFSVLVRHFLTRLVRSEEDAASSEVELGVGALLGLLSVPGSLVTFILLSKYSSFLNWLRGNAHQDYFLISLPDKYLFIAMAMSITGIVTVLKWDKILPDQQDYLNLAPLPIRRRMVLLANATAIAIAVLVFAVDVNAVPSVLFPLFVCSAGQLGFGAFLSFAAIHVACMLLASLFSFCLVFATLGVISAILPREVFRAVSSWLRGLLLVAFLMVLFSGLASPFAFLTALHRDPNSPVRFLPSLWFLGMYQSWQHRATPVMAELTRIGAWGIPGTLALALLSCGLSYRRRFAASLEGGSRPKDLRLSAAILRLLDLFAAGAGSFVRACHRFTVRALLRHETHRLCIAVALTIGWLVGWTLGGLAAPLSAAYVLMLGLRLAFELPAGAQGAWIFRAILDPLEHETLPVARRVIFSFLTPLVLLPALGLAWWHSGFPTALLQLFYVTALSLVAAELQLVGFRKIPLTCPMPGFRDHLLMLCLIQLLGFVLFTRGGAAMETWMLSAPLRLLLLPVTMLGAWELNRKRLRDAREAGELEEGLTFENIHTPAVERLNL